MAKLLAAVKAQPRFAVLLLPSSCNPITSHDENAAELVKLSNRRSPNHANYACKEVEAALLAAKKW